MNRYYVRRTICDCHPETCCCSDYEIIDSEKKEVWMRLSDKLKLNSICEALNKGNIKS